MFGGVSGHHARAIDRYNFARPLTNRELAEHLRLEVRNNAGESKSVIRRITRLFGGDDGDKQPICGYEIRRLLEALGTVVPEGKYKDQEMYFLPFEKVDDLTGRVLKGFDE